MSATLTINSRNYGAWSLRGWLLCRFAGLDFNVEVVDSHDPGARAELLLLSPRSSYPGCATTTGRLGHPGHRRVPPRDLPERSLLPADRVDRARCRSVSGRGAFRLRQPALGPADEHQGAPPGFPVWAGAQADIDRIEAIWSECLAASGGPYLFGAQPTMADAMYAPVCTRLRTYDVKLGADGRRLHRDDLGACPRWSSGWPPPGWSPTTSRSSKSSSDRALSVSRWPG